MNDLVLLGTVLTVDSDRRVLRSGAVYVHDGIIVAVQPASSAAPAGFADARRVRTGGIIAPGLIDLHNHLAYNTLPLWLGRDRAYETRYQWPGAPTYQSDVSNPAQALGIAAPAAALRFAEVKAVVGGVTSIQGSPPMTRAFPGWMVRNIEKEEHGEGVASTLRQEFTQLCDHRCVGDGLIGIRSTALTADDFAEWQARGGGAVVWSPFSNLWSYGGTTDVVAARAHGIRVCLGSDWTPSGTRNVLGELKVAATWNEEALGGQLSDADIEPELRRVWDDPATAVHRAREQRAVGAAVLEFEPDLPAAGDADARALDDEELDQLVRPTFDGIGHDAAWRADVVERAPEYARVLATAMARL